MNKKELHLFITDIEALHEKVKDKDTRNELNIKFTSIKEEHIKKEKSKQNVHEETQKMLYNSRGESVEVVAVDIEEFKRECNDTTRVERITQVNQKLKTMEGEPLKISCLKGYLLMEHKNAIGVKKFYDFCSTAGENYGYSLFLIRLYKLTQKYKQLKCCKLPVRFFRQRFPFVKEICLSNSKDWE